MRVACQMVDFLFRPRFQGGANASPSHGNREAGEAFGDRMGQRMVGIIDARLMPHCEYSFPFESHPLWCPIV